MSTSQQQAPNGHGRPSSTPPAGVSTEDHIKALVELAHTQNDISFARAAYELTCKEAESFRMRLAEASQVEVSDDGMMHAKTLGGLMKIGDFYAKSGMVPERFANKPHDCAIAYQMATRLKCDFFMMLQNMYVVYGTPGFAAKFLVGLLNSSGKIKGRVTYELAGDGDSRYCIASAVDAETGITHSQKCDIALAKREGWFKPRGTGDRQQPSKWATIPDLMLQYRAAAFLSRIDFPEVSLGMQTAEELEDVFGESLLGSPSATSLTSSTQDQVLASLGQTVSAPVSAPAEVKPVVKQEPVVVEAPKEVVKEPVVQEQAKKEAPKPEPVKNGKGGLSLAESAQSEADGQSNGKLSATAEKVIAKIKDASNAFNIDRIVKNATTPSTADEPLDDFEIRAILTAAAERKIKLGVS